MIYDDLMDDKVFLALDVYREGRGEPIDGQIAIAMSVLNRVHKPCWWGNDVLSVLFKKWQYSSLTDPRDKQLTIWPSKKDEVWKQCLRVASDAIYGISKDPAPHADSYFDDSIPAPKWATNDKFVCKIGRLTFYNIDMDTEVQNGKSSEPKIEDIAKERA